jgi:hypothetical protein
MAAAFSSVNFKRNATMADYRNQSGGPSASDDGSGKYSVAPYESAAAAYDTLSKDRRSVEDLGRMMAELTIPSVFPPEGYKPGDNLPGNNQSLGARCVNTLASKLMFMAMPPGRPMMRFEVIEHRLQDEIRQNPDLWSRVELGLSRLEQAHRQRAGTTSLRSSYVGMMKLLLVAGNGCWKHIKLESPTYWRPDSYVVQRDNEGNQLLVILQECVVLASLEPDIKEFILANNEELEEEPEWETEVEIYSVCKLHVGEDGERTWCYWQEYEGEIIPDTEVETDFDVPPLYAAWLIPVYGENWGRSYCEEYRGDLYTVENHAAAINDGAAAASLHLTFVKPGSRTSVKQIREAPNLSVLAGDAADVTTLRTEKASDYKFVAENYQEAARRLGYAFLLHQAIQRDAERVTAEEWQQMAAELDQAMGGLYSELAQRFQRHVVNRYVALHEDSDKNLPALPPGLIQVGVVTGIDALGRTTEGVALVRFGTTMQQVFGPKGVQALDEGDFARRLAASEGIQPEGLVKDQQRVAQDNQQMEGQMARKAIVEKGTGPLVSAMGDSMGKLLENPEAAQEMLARMQGGQTPTPTQTS